MMPPTLGLNLNQFKAMFFTQTMQKVQRQNKRNLSKLGGWIRLASKRLIKNATKRQKTTGIGVLKVGDEVYSKPGHPPLNKIGLLKKFIFYGYDNSTDSVVIGPMKLNRKGTAPNALEYGGRVLVTVGGYRWKQLSGGLWVREWLGPVRKEARAILARPYMRVALDRARKEKKFEAFWKDSL